jgi:SpoVK/Ycf46/Vps4 family AAA+-type ATPase
LLDEVLAAFPAEAPPCLVWLDAPASGAVLTRLRLPRLSLELPPPSARERARIWAECLERDGIQHAADVDLLAARYRMSREQIEAAICAARGELAWQSAAGSRPSQLTTNDLAAAARIEIRVDLGSLATRIESHRGWGDLVVPGDVLDQLREFCDRVTRRGQVLDDGGFAGRLGTATGVPALFAGPSGSGKTMAAGIVAAELGLDCFKINLAAVVSKYIGETEKNLEQVFAAAEQGDLLLFFDECDALFGKRSEVRDARDRYANIEVAYLLQRLESYPGPVILATNLLSDLDEAFTRRMAFTIHFPLPGPAERRHIWERIWPGQTRVAPDVDAGELARRYALSGGNIRNIAVAGAFLAAGDGGPVTRQHVLHAVRREYQKLGAEPPEVPDA